MPMNTPEKETERKKTVAVNTDNDTIPSRSKIKKPVKILSVILVLFFALYAGYWNFVTQSFQKFYLEFEENQNQFGTKMRHENLSVSGFPFSMTMKITDISATTVNANAWNVPVIEITANPLNLYDVSIIIPETANFQSLNEEFPVFISFKELTLSRKTSLSDKQNVKFGVKDINVISYDTETQSQKNVLPSSIDTVTLDIDITPPLNHPLSSEKEARNWQNQNGKAVVRELHISNSDVTVELSGITSLTQELQPTFKGSLSITGLAALLEDLNQEKFINEDMEKMVLGATYLVNSGAAPKDSQPVIFPIKVDNGGTLFVGPFPVTQIPHVNW